VVKATPYVWRLLLNLVGLAAAVAAGMQRFGLLMAPFAAICGWRTLVEVRILSLGIPKVDAIATSRARSLLESAGDARRVTVTVREWLLQAYSEFGTADDRRITLAAPMVNRLSDTELTSLIKYLSASSRNYPAGWRAANQRWGLVVVIGPAAVTGALLAISVPLAVAAGAASLDFALYAWLIWRAASFANSSWLLSQFGDEAAAIDIINAGLSSSAEAESRIKSTLLWRCALLPYRYYPTAGRVAQTVERIQGALTT